MGYNARRTEATDFLLYSSGASLRVLRGDKNINTGTIYRSSLSPIAAMSLLLAFYFCPA